MEQPDLVLRLLPLSGKDRYARTPDKGLDPHPGFTFGVTVLQPRSRGTCHIQSNDPLQQAAMDPKYLSHEADAQLFLDGMRVARKVAQMPALKPLIVRETRPGPEVQDDAGLLDYMRGTIQTSWHMVGTCKMGVDADAVVDPELRVHGHRQPARDRFVDLPDDSLVEYQYSVDRDRRKGRGYGVGSVTGSHFPRPRPPRREREKSPPGEGWG